MSATAPLFAFWAPAAPACSAARRLRRQTNWSLALGSRADVNRFGCYNGGRSGHLDHCCSGELLDVQ